jgi:hypothetical protein
VLGLHALRRKLNYVTAQKPKSNANNQGHWLTKQTQGSSFKLRITSKDRQEIRTHACDGVLKTEKIQRNMVRCFQQRLCAR